MDWKTYLKADSLASDSFCQELERLKAEALRQMEQADNFDQVLEARGGKKMLDLLQASFTMMEREEKSRVAYLRRSQGK